MEGIYQHGQARLAGVAWSYKDRQWAQFNGCLQDRTKVLNANFQIVKSPGCGSSTLRRSSFHLAQPRVELMPTQARFAPNWTARLHILRPFQLWLNRKSRCNSISDFSVKPVVLLLLCPRSVHKSISTVPESGSSDNLLLPKRHRTPPRSRPTRTCLYGRTA